MLKSQSPIHQISSEIFFSNPPSYNPIRFSQRDGPVSRMVEPQIGKVDSHPYYTNMVKSPPAPQKRVILKDSKLVINFTYDKYNRVRNIPVENSRSSTVSFMKKASSMKSLHV